MVYVWAAVDDAGVIDEQTIRGSRDQTIAAFLVERRSTEPLHLAWQTWEGRGFRCERFRLVAAPAPSTVGQILRMRLPFGRPATGSAGDAVGST